jgi:hypothetical protein
VGAPAAAAGAAGGRVAGGVVLTGFGSSVPIPSSSSGLGASLISGVGGGAANAAASTPLQQQHLQPKQAQQQQQQAGSIAAAAAAGSSGPLGAAAPTSNTAAAALTALFADASGGGAAAAAGAAGGELRCVSDVALAGDQGPGGLLNLDSFTGGEQQTLVEFWRERGVKVIYMQLCRARYICCICTMTWLSKCNLMMCRVWVTS